MDKVILTMEQASALDEMFADNWVNREILKGHIQSEYIPWEKYGALNNMPFDDLAKALYVGYEVEQTPEERVITYYKSLRKDGSYEAAEAIEKALSILKIEIEGVNI